ncbi:MAG: hypothetical protein U0O18_05605 [Clostridia bacterium]
MFPQIGSTQQQNILAREYRGFKGRDENPASGPQPLADRALRAPPASQDCCPDAGFHIAVYADEKKNLEKTGRKTKNHWDKRHDLTENVVL